ncbi:MAG: hypothetical protein ACI843_002605 [Psychrobacter glaciei]|jgi:hypothetical protein
MLSKWRKENREEAPEAHIGSLYGGSDSLGSGSD